MQNHWDQYVGTPKTHIVEQFNENNSGEWRANSPLLSLEDAEAEAVQQRKSSPTKPGWIRVQLVRPTCSSCGSPIKRGSRSGKCRKCLRNPARLWVGEGTDGRSVKTDAQRAASRLNIQRAMLFNPKCAKRESST